ncbi:hypothetical protein [Neorhodopirellula lusitana]|uniref:hypothetical protein n=1 Tax=Neorhodopirellula lusitana TaxID=445327 RepID=UPI00384FF9FD
MTGCSLSRCWESTRSVTNDYVSYEFSPLVGLGRSGYEVSAGHAEWGSWTVKMAATMKHLLVIPSELPTKLVSMIPVADKPPVVVSSQRSDCDTVIVQ